MSTSSINGPLPSPGFNAFGRAESPLYHMPAPVPEIPLNPATMQQVQNGWGMHMMGSMSEPGLPAQSSEVTLGNVARPYDGMPQAVLHPMPQLAPAPPPPGALVSPASAPSELVGLGLHSTPPTSRPQSRSTVASKNSVCLLCPASMSVQLTPRMVEIAPWSYLCVVDQSPHQRHRHPGISAFGNCGGSRCDERRKVSCIFQLLRSSHQF